MIKHPLVSICIPAYNVERWIGQCIESSISQDYPYTEIIVSDDCSTDQTVDIVNQYARYGVRLIQPDHNLGMCGNWNYVLRASKGELLLKLDADDWLYTDYLKVLVPVMISNPTVAFATCDFNLVEINGNLMFTEHRIWPLGVCSGNEEFLRYIYGAKCKGNCVLIRRSHFEAVGGYDNRFIYAGDWGLYLMLLLNGDIYYSDQVLANYRVHDLGKLNRPLWEAQDRLLVINMLPDIWPKKLVGLELHLKKVKRLYAYWTILAAAQAPDCIKSELLSIVTQIDQSYQTRLFTWLAMKRLGFLLLYPKLIRMRTTRFIKRLLVLGRQISVYIKG